RRNRLPGCAGAGPRGRGRDAQHRAPPAVREGNVHPVQADHARERPGVHEVTRPRGMKTGSRISETIERGAGILRLVPIFVPRRFAKAGRRLRLHPDDYYALGTARGSIKERWFSSVIPCMNGPLAPPDEGLSYVLPASDRLEEKFTLLDAQRELGATLVGEDLMRQHGGWPIYSKFFDYETPLFHHLHLSFDAAAAVRRLGKPEA